MRLLGLAVLCIAVLIMLGGCGEDNQQILPIAPDASEDFIAGAPPRFDNGKLIKARVFYLKTGVPLWVHPDFRPDVHRIEGLMTTTQEFFASEMTRHGYGRKTFDVIRDRWGRVEITTIEMDAWDVTWFRTEEPSVHKIIEYFGIDDVLTDVNPYLNNNMDVFFIDMDVSVRGRRVGGYASSYNGCVISGDAWRWQTVAHEVGHILGLAHNFRDGNFIMSYGSNPSGIPESEISAGAAGMLNRHPAFNSGLFLKHDKPHRVWLTPCHSWQFSFSHLFGMHNGVDIWQEWGSTIFEVRIAYYEEFHDLYFGYDFAYLHEGSSRENLSLGPLFTDNVTLRFNRDNAVYRIVFDDELLRTTEWVHMKMLGTNLGPRQFASPYIYLDPDAEENQHWTHDDGMADGIPCRIAH